MVQKLKSKTSRKDMRRTVAIGEKVKVISISLPSPSQNEQTLTLFPVSRLFFKDGFLGSRLEQSPPFGALVTSCHPGC